MIIRPESIYATGTRPTLISQKYEDMINEQNNTGVKAEEVLPNMLCKHILGWWGNMHLGKSYAIHHIVKATNGKWYFARVRKGFRYSPYCQVMDGCRVTMLNMECIPYTEDNPRYRRRL